MSTLPIVVNVAQINTSVTPQTYFNFIANNKVYFNVTYVGKDDLIQFEYNIINNTNLRNVQVEVYHEIFFDDGTRQVIAGAYDTVNQQYAYGIDRLRSGVNTFRTPPFKVGGDVERLKKQAINHIRIIVRDLDARTGTNPNLVELYARNIIDFVDNDDPRRSKAEGFIASTSGIPASFNIIYLEGPLAPFAPTDWRDRVINAIKSIASTFGFDPNQVYVHAVKYKGNAKVYISGEQFITTQGIQPQVSTLLVIIGAIISGMIAFGIVAFIIWQILRTTSKSQAVDSVQTNTTSTDQIIQTINELIRSGKITPEQGKQLIDAATNYVRAKTELSTAILRQINLSDEGVSLVGTDMMSAILPLFMVIPLTVIMPKLIDMVQKK